MQPGVQHFVHVLLHQQFADLRPDLLQGHDLDPGLLHVRHYLGAVVRFDLFGLHVDVGPQAHLDEVHHLHLAPHIRFDLALRESVRRDQLLPASLVAGGRNLRPQLGQVGANFLARRRQVVRINHLDFQHPAIDQPLQGADAVRLGHAGQRLLLHEGFKADGVVPIALQHGFAIHRGDHAVDHLSGEGRHRRQQQDTNRDV